MKHSTLTLSILCIFLGGISLGIVLFLLGQESKTSSVLNEQTEYSAQETSSQGEVSPTITFASSKLGTVDTDLPYCSQGKEHLLMDMHWPTQGAGPFPLVVYVHGGGWVSGDKSENIQPYAQELTARGIAVAAVNYRLAKSAPFPAMIEDVACAVRHLRTHATTYNIDPDAIGAFGGSAGGHLASLLGTASDTPNWTVSAYTNISSNVAAVTEFFGPTNLQEAFEGNNEQTLKRVFAQNTYENMAFASPITFITPNDPPFLIFHGEEDTLVPISQSESFTNALITAGIDTTFVRVANATHTFAPVNKTVPISPTIPEIAVRMSEWFVDQLK